MKRYVLAVVLTVSLVGIGLVAVDHGAQVRGETATETAIATIDDAAVSLFDNEVPPVAGERPPQRTITVDFPGDGFVETAPERVAVESVPAENLTRVEYRVDGRAHRTVLVDAPLTYEGQRTFDLAGFSGETRLHLRLVTDGEGHTVVDLSIDT